MSVAAFPAQERRTSGGGITCLTQGRRRRVPSDERCGFSCTKKADKRGWNNLPYTREAKGVSPLHRDTFFTFLYAFCACFFFTLRIADALFGVVSPFCHKTLRQRTKRRSFYGGLFWIVFCFSGRLGDGRRRRKACFPVGRVPDDGKTHVCRSGQSSSEEGVRPGFSYALFFVTSAAVR